MMTSPPTSPDGPTRSRPQSALYRPPPRSNSRMSVSSKQGGGLSGSRASDEDGRTSVKVAVRVRPPLKPSDPGFDLIPQRFQRSMVQVTAPTSLTVTSPQPQGRKLFVFDRVFDEDVPQDGVWDYVRDSVNSFVQGYNVSILAYGQSGAGKSYTMGTSGPAEQNDPVNKGIVPRAAAALFENLEGKPPLTRPNSGLKTPSRYSIATSNSLSYMSKATTEKNWQLKATYVEIYNEQLRDLLLPDSVPVHERAPVSIREDNKGRILLTGLKQVAINSIEDLLNALNFGSTIRQTDATAINAKSSRSHAVLSLNLIQKKTTSSMMSQKEKRMSVPIEAMSGNESYVTVDSKLHFVDLAGSERLKNTGVSGERVKEGISINAGLASLGKVIAQLSSRQAGSHVSYRDSRLTRLLQDSLGGNAITYMVACVTPAEFHLSETLNTVQYAQRARNIQSKPRIQQVADDADKQALIDRLRAEIGFLRQQIRNNTSPERRTAASSERLERQSERESELQDSLLDMQESYTALSQRHAKLISELTQGGEIPDGANHVTGESAVDRLKRSQANQQQIEQVILEYEKTIQSLESNLSTTRSSLANTESNLLERETNCAFVETMNQQLQSRVQKLMERETNTERYLHELESRVDGQASGEEKSSVAVAELRKEIARYRETEASSEDYISTLEERLAEAEQDMELMQQETERLAHVVERQRSLGKLDNLLYELDHIQQNGRKMETPKMNGHHLDRAEETRKSLATLKEAAEKSIPEESDEDWIDVSPEHIPEHGNKANDDSGLQDLEKATVSPTILHELSKDAPAQSDRPESSAQSKHMADKLDVVTQELVDLRLEHDSTINELDIMSAKYHEALRTLAEMQDAVDEARHPAIQPTLASPTSTTRPLSFLADARTNEQEDGGHSSSSRSLSSELSLAGESPELTEGSEVNVAAKKRLSGEKAQSVEKSADIQRLQRALEEHEKGMLGVTKQYAQLQAEHQETLSTVQRLKAEAQKAKAALPPPSPTHMPPVIRRMTSQNVMTVDRAHRSLASLRNIAVEEFESRPDTMQTVDGHLNTAMHELHSRMERIQALEAENKSVKQEIERKTTFIAGLTRERNSRHRPGASIDLGAMTQMQEQLQRTENEIRILQETHAAREQGLRKEIQALNESLTAQKSATSSPIESDDQGQKIATLKEELLQWQAKHSSAVESVKVSEKRLTSTMAQVETALASAQGLRGQDLKSEDISPAEKEALDDDRARYEQLLSSLRKNLEDHQTIIESHAETIASLQEQHKRNILDHQATINSHAESIARLEREHCEALEERLSAVKSTEDQLSALQEQNRTVLYQAEQYAGDLESKDAHITHLQKEIQGQTVTLNTHKDNLQKMHEVHAREIDALRHSIETNALADYEAEQTEITDKHDKVVQSLHTEIKNLRGEMQSLADISSETLGVPVSFDHLHEHLEKLASDAEEHRKHSIVVAQKVEALEQQLQTRHGDHASIEKELADSKVKVAQHQETVRNLANEVANHEETLRAKDSLLKKKDASLESVTTEKQNLARIIEELEQQIESSFDQHHNRLSVVQAQSSQALVEAQNRIGVLEKELDSVKSQRNSLSPASAGLVNGDHRSQSPPVDPARSNSMTSNLRKSASAASLPSPPPAIPLPPLPTISALSANNVNGTSASPPSSRHTSKDLPSSAAHLQLIEDQEARIRTIEKHLHAEKQLTATLEEALVDLETQTNKVRGDLEGWKKKAWAAEEEVARLGKERRSERLSVQAVEEERDKRREAERARRELEERMARLSGSKKKKGGLNCF